MSLAQMQMTQEGVIQEAFFYSPKPLCTSDSPVLFPLALTQEGRHRDRPHHTAQQDIWAELTAASDAPEAGKNSTTSVLPMKITQH